MSVQSGQQQLLRIMGLYQNLPREPAAHISLSLLKNKLCDQSNEYANLQDPSKTLKRDLGMLRHVLSFGQVDIIMGSGKRDTHARLSKDASIEKLHAETALALVMAQSYLKQTLPHSVYQAVSGLLSAAEQQLETHTSLKHWPTRMQFVQDHACQQPTEQSSIDQSSTDQIATTVYDAILNKQVLNMRYTRESDEKTYDYTIVPQGIIHKGHQQFLIAIKLPSKLTRTYCLHRILWVDQSEKELPVVFDEISMLAAVQNQEHEDALMNRTSQTVILYCDDGMRAELRRFPLGINDCYPDYHCAIDEDDQDGYDQDGYDQETLDELNETDDEAEEESQDFYYQFEAILTTSLQDWLYQHADQVTVLEPALLKRRIAQRIQQAERRYNSFQQHLLPGYDEDLVDF